MSKSTLIDHRITKKPNMSGPQQPLVPGSHHAGGSGGKAPKGDNGNGRGKNL